MSQPLPTEFVEYLKNERNLKPASVKVYENLGKKISPEFNLEAYENWHTTVTDEVKAKSNYRPLLNLIKLVLAFYKKNTKIYDDLFDEASVAQAISPPKEATEEDKQKQVSLDDIKEIFEQKKKQLENKDGTMRTAYEVQFLSLILDVGAFRSQDYISLSFDKKSPNYYDDGKLIFTQGKSVNSQRVVVLNEQSKEIIERNRARYKKDWLFPTLIQSRNTPMSRNIFADFIKKIFGKDVATRVLRQVVVGDAIDKKMPAKERMKLAKNMGHTIQTSQAEYSKFSEMLHSRDKKIAELEATIQKMKEQDEVKDKIIKDLLARLTKK
jgi:hypothetical protein